MYRIDDIYLAFAPLLGWRQGYAYNGTLLDNDLLVSESKEYYQDQHSYLTLENLKAVIPDFSIANFPTWDNAVLYTKDTIVKRNAVNYIALEDNTGIEPGTNADEWAVFNPLSKYLREKTYAAVTKMIQTFIEQKMEVKTAKSLMDNSVLFDGVGMINDTITNLGRKAGIEIGVAKSKGVTATLDRVGAQFDTIGEITIYLYHSSQKNALKQQILTYDKAGSMQWFDLGWQLPYVSNDTDAGGYYYVVYDQDAIAGKAINKNRNWASPCMTCGDYGTFMTYNQYIEITPLTITASGPDMWDINNNRYDYFSNFGLNFGLSINCDYTDFFVEQKDLFKSVMGKQLAMILLRDIAYNPHSKVNRNESTVSREQLIYEIDGDTRGRDTGIKAEYKTAMNAIQVSTEGLNRVCLPCKGNGVKYKTT